MMLFVSFIKFSFSSSNFSILVENQVIGEIITSVTSYLICIINNRLKLVEIIMKYIGRT